MTEPTIEELQAAIQNMHARYIVARDERNELVILNAQLQQQLADLQKETKDDSDG